MAANLLHSLRDDNLELQKQIGCMTGIFQLFDRHHILTGGSRRMVAQSPKRLPHGMCEFSSDTPERECMNAKLRSAPVEKYSYKNIQEKQRISTESSRPSFSSSSRSSSFSSLECNRATQLEPSSFDRIIFPETPSKDHTMSLQSLSPQFGRQNCDLRDLVKDSMYREIHASSAKAKNAEKAPDPVIKSRDSPRTTLEITGGSRGSGLDPRQRVLTDLKDSPGVLAKLQESPWYHDEARTLLRSSSYHSKDSSSYSISRDAPRFSYDGREVNRAPLDSRDVSKSTLKLKDLPRLSLDSKAGSMRSLNADSKSNFLKSVQQDSGVSDDKVQNRQQSPGHHTRPPSVVAKLMGLETLPESFSSTDTNSGSNRSYPDKDFVNTSRSVVERDTGVIPQSSSTKNFWKDPSSPRWRSPDSSTKTLARFPNEAAPWKQIDKRRSSQKSISGTKIAHAKGETAFPSVYSEIEKRLKDLEFTRSGKDLRALKQILEAIQSKGFLQSQKEVLGSNFFSDIDHRKQQTEQVLASMKRRTRRIESPIVIMKPAKLVEKSGISAASVVSLDTEFVGNRKGYSSGRMAKDLGSKSSQQDNAVSCSIMKNDRALEATQTSIRSQPSNKDGNAGFRKSSGSISPRMQQKELELEKRSRPPMPPDSSRSRRHSSKQQGDSHSPGGQRRPRHPNIHESRDKLSEVINVESGGLSSHENENSVQSNALVATSEKSSTLVQKNATMALSQEESADFGIVPLEYSSPVSVLDDMIHKDDSPSPVKYTAKAIKVDVSIEEEKESNSVQVIFPDVCIPTSEMNDTKLRNIENLVQKLRRLNSSHDEARTDYIASLCDNTDPDHRCISEILLASGLLLRDLGSSLTNFQFHSSGHPINPELFLVLEQTKASTLLEENFSPEKKTQLLIKGKIRRKLIFDTVNEILARKLASAGPSSEPWFRPLKRSRQALNGQKLLRELCSEIEELQARNPGCSSSEEDERWKSILYKDVMQRPTESWIDFDEEISGAILDIERAIFKDLVDEIVVGESAGLKTKTARRRRLSAKSLAPRSPC